MIIGFGQLIPRDTFTQIDPPIILVELCLKRPVKFSEGQLFVALITDHRYTIPAAVGLFFVRYHTGNLSIITIISVGYDF